MSSPSSIDRPASYSTAEVAEKLGVSVPTVQRWVDAGHLKAWKTPGGHRRIEARSAERLFQAHAAGMDIEEQAVGARRQVMLVDDSPDDRDVLSAVVQEALPDADLAVFENGIQALVAIGQRAPDILITDIRMPYLDGVEMLRQLADRCVVKPALTIVVSASVDAAGKPRHRLPAGVRFVPKPIDAARMVAMLRDSVR